MEAQTMALKLKDKKQRLKRSDSRRLRVGSYSIYSAISAAFNFAAFLFLSINDRNPQRKSIRGKMKKKISYFRYLSKASAAFKLMFIVAVVCSTAFLYAAGNSGQIKGRILDASTGEPLIGANVMLKGSVYGSATDLDGSYYISGVPVGQYSLVVRYVGYERKELTNASVVANDIISYDILLNATVMNLNEVVVQAESKKSSDAFLLANQKKSDKIQDGISSELMARAGDSNAADAVKRITGVSVQDGKYISVRGLGDRYVSTAMNGVPIPSPEPEKKTVPLNLFSTSIIESITAYKTYTPDLPAVFAGGFVNIKTKAYPDTRILNMSLGLSGKSTLLGAEYISGTRGKWDYFGFDDGSRAIPDIIPEDRMLSQFNPAPGYSYSEWYAQLGAYGQAFQTGYTFNRTAVGQPLSFGLNFGDRYIVSRDFEYGFYTDVNFGNSYSYKEEIYKRYAISDEDMIARTDIENKKSSYNTNLSASMSTGMKYRSNNKIKLYILYTHSSESSFTYGSGKTPNLDEDGIYLREFFSEKSLLNSTLSGNHAFPNFLNSRLEWAANAGISFMSEPDVKSQNYSLTSGNYYEVARSSAKAGQRYYTDGFDRNANFDMNYSGKIKDYFGDLYKFKLGSRFQYKDRQFEKRDFYHQYSSGSWPMDLIRVDGDDFGTMFADSNYVQEEGDEGLILLESTDMASRNGYWAQENIMAGYAMMDVPLGFNRFEALNDFRFIGGFRYEYYNMHLVPYNPVTGGYYTSPLINNGETAVVADIIEAELLPSFNLNYNMGENAKMRLSYSETVSRPEFREVAPFEFQQFYGGSAVVGYPDLKTTDIRNLDYRYEWHHGTGELLAVGAFAKWFANPIEISQIETADECYLTYQNALSANTYGLEIDFRNRLPIVDETKGKVLMIFNTTLSQSEVEADDEITLFNGVTISNNSTTLKRPLQGQSDIMINGSLSYTGITGWKAAVSYNTFSKRLSALGSGDIPNEYELPFHSLNLTFGKRFGSFKVDAKVSNILNSQVRYGLYDDDNVFHASRQYAPGLGYSIKVKYVFK